MARRLPGGEQIREARSLPYTIGGQQRPVHRIGMHQTPTSRTCRILPRDEASVAAKSPNPNAATHHRQVVAHPSKLLLSWAQKGMSFSTAGGIIKLHGS